MKNAKHNETKEKTSKIKISNILIFILIIVAIILIIIIGTKYSERKKNEDSVKAVVSQINTGIQNNEEEIEQIPYIEYEGYQVIGTIQIPKINIEYPILAQSDEIALEKSITRVGNGTVNDIGNLTLAGHNYIDGSMFGKIDELQNEDEISILDLYGNRITYKVFNIYVTNPDDVSVLEPIEENTREITLITCINGNKNRLIIKAREI